MAWRRHSDPFPAPLQEFREEDWPPVEGECLGHYACRGEGYGRPCVTRPGEFCGQAHYEMLARDHPDRPELLARARAADAYERFTGRGWAGSATITRCGWMSFLRPDAAELRMGEGLSDEWRRWHARRRWNKARNAWFADNPEAAQQAFDELVGRLSRPEWTGRDFQARW